MSPGRSDAIPSAPEGGGDSCARAAVAIEKTTAATVAPRQRRSTTFPVATRAKNSSGGPVVGLRCRGLDGRPR